jgi:anaerobic dimethyl sulfoxide reductase subunit C (anchor subunit)
MNTRDWALIAFTILAQMSVGSFLVLRIVHYLSARKAGLEEADRLSDRALLAIVPALVLGMIASLFHLGDPLTAYTAVTNLGSSWLSREVLFGVVFAVLGAIFAFMQWRKIASIGVRNVIAWIAVLAGLALVYCMSRIYMLPTQPAWNTLATPILNFVTTLLLGSLAMGVAFVANYAYVQRKVPDCADVQCGLMRDALRWIAVVSVILLGIELGVVALRSAFLASGSQEAIASVAMLIDPYGVVFALQLLLVFVGAGVFGIFLYQNAQNPGREKVLTSLAYIAFALVLIAEVLGRFLFYATSVQITV